MYCIFFSFKEFFLERFCAINQTSNKRVIMAVKFRYESRIGAHSFGLVFG